MERACQTHRIVRRPSYEHHRRLGILPFVEIELGIRSGGQRDMAYTADDADDRGPLVLRTARRADASANGALRIAVHLAREGVAHDHNPWRASKVARPKCP